VRALNDDRRTGIFEEFLESSAGDPEGDFLELLESHQAGTLASAVPPMEFQREDALVLLDLIDELSEAGEERPEEVVEYIDGLSGRTDDSEIQ
jgi:hypothetical protein